MDIYVLNKQLDLVAIIDAFESFIWTDRYDECGDFELYAPDKTFSGFDIAQDYYLQQKDSEHLMIIEKFLIKSDVEDGSHLTISGRSLESILDRRIVWGLTMLSGNFQNEMKRLLTENLINPSDPDRAIPNMIFEDSSDPAITSLSIEAQYTGDNIYDIVCNACKEVGIGFQITLNSSNQFVFKFYSGTDHSFSQSVNPFVIFSPKFENLLNSNYVQSKETLKTVTLVGGEGEGAERKYAVAGYSVSGLDRREMFTDANDVSSNVEEGEPPITDEQYTALLVQRGLEKLAENLEEVTFEGEADAHIMYTYGVDFLLGDVVQIENEYGMRARARISEVVTSNDDTGFSIYPTFKTITEEE